MTSSGGIVPNNFRQGYRAEYLARYIISEFGPCERVTQENDYGIDLIATIMRKSGSVGYVSQVYGVQVKSGDANFHYSGDEMFAWLKANNIPILMCRADRQEGRVRLYSTWTLHCLVLDHVSDPIVEANFIEDYGNADTLRMPEVQDKKATIWLGKPILDVRTSDLNKPGLVAELASTLNEWVGFDAANYFRRHAGIPIGYGYTIWETNKSLETSKRLWYKPHFFSDSHSVCAMKLIQECATVIALNKGKDSELTKDLAQIVKKYGVDVDPFTKDVLQI